MIKKLFKLVGLVALLTSACVPLSLHATNTDILKQINATHNPNELVNVFNAISENDQPLYHDDIKNRLFRWISWEIQPDFIKKAISNKKLEEYFTKCGMSQDDFDELLIERRFLLGEMNTPESIKRLIKNIPVNIENIIRIYKCIDENQRSSYHDAIKKRLANWMDWFIKPKNPDKTMSNKDLEEKFKKCGMGQNDCDELLAKRRSRFDWLTNNSYFKPTVITLSVITMGIVSLWAFKKFCPQYSTKISSLFKLPRLWSRTPKVNPLQHNFNYAV